MNYLAIFLFLVISSANCLRSVKEDNESGYGLYEELLPPKETPSSKKNQSARGIWEVSPQSQGVSSLFCDGWATPVVSVSNSTNFTYYSESVCSKNSVLSQIVTNLTYETPFVCNGLASYIMPWSFQGMIDGSYEDCEIGVLSQRRANLNGNVISVSSGLITEPDKCKGSIVFIVSILLANNQYQCATTGLEGQKIIYQLTLINGPCQSYCWLSSGYTELDPPINNYGNQNSTAPAMRRKDVKKIK